MHLCVSAGWKTGNSGRVDVAVLSLKPVRQAARLETQPGFLCESCRIPWSLEHRCLFLRYSTYRRKLIYIIEGNPFDFTSNDCKC